MSNTGPGGQKLIQHYFSVVGPTFTLERPPEPTPYWDGFNESAASFILYYDIMPPRITYLHVVEYEIQVNVA